MTGVNTLDRIHKMNMISKISEGFHNLVHPVDAV